ncbi:MAG: response regulator [Chromatiales bacterium]|jgi:signal transduction histidine kinase/DNA-binding response OmpR family regulator
MPDEARRTEGANDVSLHAILDELAEPMLALDKNLQIIYANQAAIQLPDIHTQQIPVPLASAFSDASLSQMLEHSLQLLTTTTHTPTSEFIWKLGHESYLIRVKQSANGYLILFLAISLNSPIKERVETDHMHRLWATALAGIGSWTWNLDSNRLHSDSILAALTGRDDESTFSATDMFEQVHPDDLPALQRALQQALDWKEEDEVDIDVEFRFTPHDQEEVWLAMRGGVIRDNNGKPIMLSGVHFDVTERKRVEQSVMQAKTALEEANRAKDSFLAKVSHEIRTPLTTILGYAELLAARLKEPQNRKDLTEIIDSSRYLHSLINDLLDLSRIIAGKVSTESAVLGVHTLAQELLSTMNMRAAEKNIDFTLNIEGDVAQTTWSDPVRVRQILTNLCGNAVRYTQQGGVTLNISTRKRNNTDCIVFRVDDTGPGIDDDKLASLFQPFVQMPGADSGRQGGLGLGLAISQRLAEVLGGSIEVQSKVGQGSSFSFLLPHAKVSQEQMTRSQKAAEKKQRSLQEIRLDGDILVVDDVKPIQALLKKQLSTAGARVTTAEDGIQALQQLETAARTGHMFDLILMDLHMPHLNGQETLLRLREAGYNMPVIALTASAMKGERQRCLQWGFNDFISKPFDSDQLLRTVARMLQLEPDSREIQQESKNLLLVEDHEALAELTARQLASLGYIVEVTHTGAAAIDRCRALQPSAIVTDMNLPDIDGIELARIIRENEVLKGCRLIAYTGLEEPEQHARAKQAGFDDVLIKPANTGDFARVLADDAG